MTNPSENSKPPDKGPLPSLTLPVPARSLIVIAILLLLGLGIASYFAALPLVSAAGGTMIPGTPGIRGFVLHGDADTGNLTFEEVLALNQKGAFTPMPPPETEDFKTKGLSDQRWNRLEFDNPTGDYKRITLDLIWRIYDKVTLYTPSADGTWKRSCNGECVSPRDPERSGRWRAFDIVLPPQQTLTVFVHTKDYYRLPTQFRYWSNPVLFSDREHFIFNHLFAYFGLWFGMVAYGFFLYAMLRQRDQLYYVLFISFMGLSSFFSSNMANLFFSFPAFPLREIIGATGSLAALISLCLFTRHFLETATRDPAFDRLISRILWLLIAWSLTFPLGLWTPTAMRYLMSYILFGAGISFTLLWGSVRAWRKGSSQAFFFFLAFTPFAVGLLSLGLHPRYTLVQDDPQRLSFILGLALNMLLLSLAPAYRHRLAQSRNIKLHEKYTEQLESQVQSRTRVLQSFNDHLSATVDERNRIITIIGHDLRTPAASLHSLARALAHDAEGFDREHLTHLANQISHACVLQFELLNNLLIWGGTQSGRWQARKDDLCLLEVIATAWDYLDSVASDKAITLRTSIPADLLITSDAQLLQTVLRNLLANAIKYSHPQSAIEVSALTNGESKSVEICIKDCGIGITPEQVAQLFSCTIRSTPGTQEEHGSGIGLTLCRDLIRAIGGEVRIESVPNLGTNVAFTLPNALLPSPIAPQLEPFNV